MNVKIDSKITHNAHVNDICNKARQKLNALARKTPYLYFHKKDYR